MPLMTSLVKAGRYKCIVVGQTIRDVTMLGDSPNVSYEAGGSSLESPAAWARFMGDVGASLGDSAHEFSSLTFGFPSCAAISRTRAVTRLDAALEGRQGVILDAAKWGWEPTCPKPSATNADTVCGARLGPKGWLPKASSMKGRAMPGGWRALA